MPARHAVLLIPPVSLRPSQLICYKQHEQTNFHSPYTLPSSVSCKSCVCHSYANTRGVGVFFPFWNLLVGCWRFDPGSQRLSRSSTDYCQLITDLSTDLPRPCRGHCHPCLKSFSCNTYGSPASVANKRLTAWLNSLDATLTKNRGGCICPSTFRFFDVQMRSLHPRWGYGTRTFRRCDMFSSRQLAPYPVRVTAIPAVASVIIRKKLRTDNL
jgi:hypothetical protein